MGYKYSILSSTVKTSIDSISSSSLDTFKISLVVGIFHLPMYDVVQCCCVVVIVGTASPTKCERPLSKMIRGFSRNSLKIWGSKKVNNLFFCHFKLFFTSFPKIAQGSLFLVTFILYLTDISFNDGLCLASCINHYDDLKVSTI